MRKILSLVLVLSMVLGSFGFAFATSADVEGTDYEDAVTRLTALEILSGYPDGTFKPEKTVTRAEFAKVMANALGVGTAAQYATGATKYADVPADHWAAGYINVVSDMKIINGYGDGNFGPNDQVTYAQAVTMIVRALGYEPKASAMGGYPGGYIAVAAEQDITEDVSVVNTLAATRGDVALMVDASLDVPMMVQKTWGQYPEYEEDEDKTLLTTKLDVDEVSGTIVAIPRTDSTIEDNEVKIKNDDGTDTYELLVDVNYDILLGLEVTVWADGSDVFFLDIDTDSDDILFDTLSDATADDVYLYIDDSTYDWDKDAKVYVNFDEYDEALNKLSDDVYGYVVLDSDDEVAYANLFEYTNNAKLVTEVDGDEITVKGSGDLDLEDFDDGIHAYDKNFNVVDIADVAANSVIYTWDESDELYIVIVNETVSGNLERAKDTKITVDGEDYSIDTSAYYSADNSDSIDSFVDADSLGDLVGEDVSVILNANGDAHYVTGDVLTTSDLIFGLLKDADKSGFAYKAKIFTQDGEEVVYEFESSSDYTHDYIAALNVEELAENTLVAFELNKDGEIADEEFYVYTDNNKFENSDGANLDDDYVRVVQANNSQDADGFYFDDGDDMIVDTDDSNSSNNVRYYVEEGTVLFNVESDDDAELVKFEDVEDVTSEIELKYIIKEAKGNDLAVVVFDKIEANTSDSEYAVVTEKPSLTSDGYEVELNVYETGVKTYFLDSVKVTVDSKQVDIEDALVEGQIIEFKLNGDNEITSADILTTVKTVDQVDGRYIDIASGSSTTWVKFDTDAVIYLLDEDGDIDKTLEYDEIDENDKVIYATDSDDRIVALTVVTDATPADDTEVATDGKVTYVNDSDSVTPGVQADYVIVNGTEFEVIGIAQEFFSNEEIGVNDEIAYSVTGNNKMYAITAFDGDLTLASSYSTFADMTVNGDLVLNTGADITASNITVNGDLKVNGSADLAATNFVVEGETILNTTGDVTFNSELKGDVTVTKVGIVANPTFKNVEFGSNVTINFAGLTIEGSTVEGNFTATENVNFKGSVDIDGTITGTAKIDTTNADQTTKDAITQAIADEAADALAKALTDATAAVVTAESKEGDMDQASQEDLTVGSNIVALQEAIDATQAAHDAADLLVDSAQDVNYDGTPMAALETRLAAVQTAIDAAQDTHDVALEATKYATTVTIANSVAASADVKGTVIAHSGTPDGTITVKFAEKADAADYLTTVADTSIALAKQAPNGATDNTATVTITLVKNSASAQVDVVVTITPQP